MIVNPDDPDLSPVRGVRLMHYAGDPAMGCYGEPPESYGYFAEEPYLAEDLPYGEVDPAWGEPDPYGQYEPLGDRKSTRLNSSHRCISYAVFCLKKKTIS